MGSPQQLSHVPRRSNQEHSNSEIPTNPVVLLEIFEKINWPQQIESPIDWDNEKIRETLRTLNYRLKIIKFEQRDGSRTIQWRVA